MRRTESRAWANLRADLSVNRGNRKAQLTLVLLRATQRFSGSGNPAMRILGVPIRLLYRLLIDWGLGIEIPWFTNVGPGLRIYHGVGTVIHGAATIGSRVTIRQSVTIGTRDGTDNVPTIGDDVSIGAGAILLGGIHVGDRSVIGAGAVLLQDVPCDSVAVGNPARVLPASGDR